MSLFDQIKATALASGAFAGAEIRDDRMLICPARDCESEAAYRLEREADGRWWVSFVTPDRWLSESIEAELVHTGDDLEELLEEELIDRGVEQRLPVQHFRSEDMLFTFRTPAPVAADTDDASKAVALAKLLLAYEACFRELGDVASNADE